MALIKCVECGHEVSNKAVSCPYCGCPVSVNSATEESEPLEKLCETESLQEKKQETIRGSEQECANGSGGTQENGNNVERESEDTNAYNCDNIGSQGHTSVNEMQPGFASVNTKGTKRLWEKTWFIVLLLFVFFPAGCYLMWRGERFQKAVRILLSVIFGILFFFWIIMLVSLTAQESAEESYEASVSEGIKEQDTNYTGYDSDNLSDREIVSLIEDMLEDFDYADVSIEDGILTVKMSEDGVTLELLLSASGAEWENLKDEIIEFDDNISDFLTRCGRDDLSTSVMVLNDVNRDNVLLATYDGFVIYDVME